MYGIKRTRKTECFHHSKNKLIFLLYNILYNKNMGGNSTKIAPEPFSYNEKIKGIILFFKENADNIVLYLQNKNNPEIESKLQ